MIRLDAIPADLRAAWDAIDLDVATGLIAVPDPPPCYILHLCSLRGGVRIEASMQLPEGESMSILNWFLDLFRRPPTPVPPVPVPPAPPHPNQQILELHSVTNRARNQAAVFGLNLIAKLNQAAQDHADWMAKNRNMSHQETPGTAGFTAVNFADRLRLRGYFIGAGGENIAAGQTTVAQVMAAWLGSPGHAANIRSRNYVDVGFGIARDTSGATYWCCVFASPLGRAAAQSILDVPLDAFPPALVYESEPDLF